jgi:hypothetical protein
VVDHGTITALRPYPEVRAIVFGLAERIPAILGDDLVALYLTGSLTYGDFDAGSSDIDYLAIMEREITPSERAALAILHDDLGHRYPEWRERIEGSYITRNMLAFTLPPPQGRPYVNMGAFWEPDPPYGNEWLINLYAIQETGIALFGPAARNLVPPVRIEDVREASRRDLVDERLPELDDPGFLPDSHHEAYVTLTLCRILHREFNDGIASKRVAAAWVRDTYGEPWCSLVACAEAWQHGETLDSRDEVIAFTRFVADQLGLPNTT